MGLRRFCQKQIGNPAADQYETIGERSKHLAHIDEYPVRGHIDSMTQTLGPESVKAIMLWIFKTVDTELARKIQGQGGMAPS